MSNKPIYLAFVWHMHQPFYKDLITNEYFLPWVRLHGIKDYYDMVAILEEFPNIHQTFNLVPSLLEQIEDYVKNNVTDRYLDLSLKKASDLNKIEKASILRNLFMTNFDTMIKPYPRYLELFQKRGHHRELEELERICTQFSTQDYLDIQVWFDLSWFDPMFKDEDIILKNLIKKGKNFSEEEKTMVLKKQKEVLGLIIPEYKKMADMGRIEISTSPYYHPILPLLCDTNAARMSMPGVNLPKTRFSHPEDAYIQINKAVKLHKRLFGNSPVGMWPSEGSVSKDIIKITASNGIKWIATDEEILGESLKLSMARGDGDNSRMKGALYKPYIIENEGSSLSIVFRDHRLSDLIGFVYSKWDPRKAVDDFIWRIHEIRNNLQDQPGNHLISVILDGENAWEYYDNDGRDFLLYLYERISNDNLIKAVTVSEYLRDNPPQEKLPELFSGSWISHNFKIWIGHEEDNAAWDLVSETRKVLTAYQNSANDINDVSLMKAWDEIYIAEGSDWCWWYGDDNATELRDEFDEIFRSHLMNVYRLIKKDIPDNLRIPIIKKDKKVKPTMEQVGFIHPIIDGSVTNYFEWLSAGFFDIITLGGAMHQVSRILSRLYYGSDEKNIYLRIDCFKDLKTKNISDIIFNLHFIDIGLQNKRLRFQIFSEKNNKVEASLLKEVNGGWGIISNIETIAALDVIEIGLPLDLLGLKQGDNIELFITISDSGAEIERWPLRGVVNINVPTEEIETSRWYV